MASPIIETKLYATRPRAGTVDRPRLTALLDRAASSRLTLLSAPPGFGKSTLVAAWIAADPARSASSAWVSLDAGDDEPASFWAYVVAALERVVPAAGDAKASVGTAGTPVEAALGPLVNALHAYAGDLLLVLDDYHVIEVAAIHEAMAWLIDHLPAQAHIVISTRADPPLPLARLRARGDLLEIRAADLRFTADEAAAYLNGPMGLDLASDDVDVLEGRTEGWIAALQLAALSLGGRSDVRAFIADFAGDDRHVVDYLVDEVLDRQPEIIESFLLETSILERLSGPLCDAVTGRDDGRDVLQALDRANLFLIPLDTSRTWYRYHHLFADVLRARLADTRPADVPALHRRASAWFEANGSSADAIRHALAGGDDEHAADLIELAAHELRATRQEGTLRRWLDALPDEIFDSRPVLAITHVGALLVSSETRGVERRLQQAERWSGAAWDDKSRDDAIARGMVVRHTEVLAHLPSAIELYRAALARIRGDTASTVTHARAVLASTGDELPLERGGAAGMLGLALWTDGDLDAAHEAWSEAVRYLERADHAADVLGCSIALAEIRLTQGRVLDAERTYQRGLRLGEQDGGAPLRGTVDMHVGLAAVAVERNDLEAAREHLAAAASLGEAKGLPQSPYRLQVATARLRWAEGDLDAAVRAFDEAERRYDGDMFPDVRPIAAMRARAWLALGRIADAEAWVRQAGLGAGDERSFLGEYGHATLARVLLAKGIGERSDRTIDEALDLAGRLLDAADAAGRGGSAVDLLLVVALGRHARGDRAGAMAALGRALALAAPEGWVRPFPDEGPPMRALLKAAAGDRDAPAFVGELLAAAGPGPVARRATQPLVEPLSERELDVLRLLRSDLDGPDIARELHVSLNTLRTHTKNVYSKLGVNSRRAAVRAAAELDLR